MKLNKVQNEGLDNFFSYVSKAVIIIPIVVVVLSLMFKFGQTKTGRINSKMGSTLPTGRQVNQAPTTISTAKDNSIKFDLKGPIVCNNLFIKDKKILFKNKLINYLLNGDCFYTWETEKLNGKKECGLKNYISIVENYLGSLNINDLVNNNLIKEFIENKDININEVINSCKKGEIKDDSIFEIPKKIIFKS
jgi:hypothetical protein